MGIAMDLERDDLDRRIDEPEAVDALDIAERLFDVCFEHADEIASYRNLQGVRALESKARERVAVAVRTLYLAFPGLEPGRLWTAMTEAAEQDDVTLPPAVLARALLWGLAEGGLDAIWSGLRSRPTREVDPGECFPMPLPDYAQRIGESISSQVEAGQLSRDQLINITLPAHPHRRLEEIPCSAPHLERADDELLARFNIEFNYQFSRSISHAIGKGLPRVATIHPNRRSTELIPDDIDLDDQANRWFGAHPIDPQHVSKIRSLLSRANQEDAAIAVVPELSQTDSRHLFSLPGEFDHPSIVVAGSSHVEKKDQRGKVLSRENTAVVYINGIEAMEHRKFRPFTIKLGETEYREDLTTEAKPKLKLLCARDWTISVLICNDANDSSSIFALSNAGTNILLVPAWTPKRGYFGPHLALLGSGDRQAIVAIANGPNDIEATTRNERAPRAMFLTPWSNQEWSERMTVGTGVHCFDPATLIMS